MPSFSRIILIHNCTPVPPLSYTVRGVQRTSSRSFSKSCRMPCQSAWRRSNVSMRSCAPCVCLVSCRLYSLEHEADMWFMVLADDGGESLTHLQLAGRLSIMAFLHLAL